MHAFVIHANCKDIHKYDLSIKSPSLSMGNMPFNYTFKLKIGALFVIE